MGLCDNQVALLDNVFDRELSLWPFLRAFFHGLQKRGLVTLEILIMMFEIFGDMFGVCLIDMARGRQSQKLRRPVLK